MIPETTSTRERIVRKAKEKAVEHMHELTTSYLRGGVNSDSKSSSKRGSVGNHRSSSYKPFENTSTTQQESDLEESVDASVHEAVETPIKKGANARQKRKTPSAKEKPTKTLNLASTTTTTTNAENSLFIQILSGQATMMSMVETWIESYKKNKETAMFDLMQFIVFSSGCKSAHLVNNKEYLKSKEFSDLINDLIEGFSEEEDLPESSKSIINTATAQFNVLMSGGADAYPFAQSSAQTRRFKSNFCEFLLLLINQCQYSIIYDQFMMDIMITFLIGLADSQVRAFRHTATLAVLKIMTGLVECLLALSVQKDSCQRQYETERQKAQQKRATDRIEMLVNRKKELEENEYEIQNFINFIFRAVFIHRYRDVCAEVRCVCIGEIGEWMRRCPNKFLDDTFLKYIGWTLYDKAGECRLKCLQALQPLYEQEDLQGKVELFTSRFKNRMIEMSLDRDYDVSVAAIKLLTCVIKANDSVLKDEDCENLYELVYHSNRQVAQAAGEFLNQKLFVKVDNAPPEYKRGKKQSENSIFIQLLVQFLIESELHDHPAYLVDAMWDVHPMLKDWECMTDLLLEDPLNPEDAMEDVQERFLVEIMSCCVKQAATGEYPVARRTTTHSTRKLTAKEAKQVQDDKLSMTQHFIVVLPDLLTKYIVDAEKLVFLLQIASYFELSQYTVRRQEKSLERLLKVLQEIVEKHNAAEVLEECSRCLYVLCDEDNPIYIKCNLTRSTILDELVAAFNSSMRKSEELCEVDENDLYPLVVSLKRLAAFAENHSILQYDLVNSTFTILRWAVQNEGFITEFASRALNLARSIIVWHLHKLNNEMEERSVQLMSGTEPPPLNQDLIDTISKYSKKFYKLCNKLFVHDNPEIEEDAFFEFCDLLVLFNVHLVEKHKEYKSLVIECSTNDLNMLSVFVMNNVFIPEAITEKPDSTETIEKLHKRRCILASFCKLICYNCIPVKYAAEIFRGYIKYSTPYGDIIKHLLSCCREISRVNTAKTIALAIQREFNEVLMTQTANKTLTSDVDTNSNRIDRSQPEFMAIKDLVHRFCLSFGPEASVKSREAIVTIHQEVIRYVNDSIMTQKAPLNIALLELITEFSSRLTQQDKKLIMNELDRTFAKRANKIEENNWMPYYTYRVSLMDDVHSSSSSVSNTATNQIGANNHSTNQQTSPPNQSLASKTSETSAAHKLTVRTKRKQNFSEISGIVPLEEKSNENEDIENDLNEKEDVNSHAESTTVDFESLKLSTINNESTRTGARVTRFGRKLGVNSPAKRARSPLVNNNSINESSEQMNILTSTRIEPIRTRKATIKSSVAQAMIHSDMNNEEVDEETLPISKRTRRSQENDSINN